MLLFAVDAPNREFLEDTSKGHAIEDVPPECSHFPNTPFPDEPLPDGAFRGTFVFTREHNSYLYIAAQTVQYRYLSEARLIC